MSKPKTQPVSTGESPSRQEDHREKPIEPLSGSKTVKNRQHSRNNHGEGL